MSWRFFVTKLFPSSILLNFRRPFRRRGLAILLPNFNIRMLNLFKFYCETSIIKNLRFCSQRRIFAFFFSAPLRSFAQSSTCCRGGFLSCIRFPFFSANIWHFHFLGQATWVVLCTCELISFALTISLQIRKLNVHAFEIVLISSVLFKVCSDKRSWGENEIIPWEKKCFKPTIWSKWGCDA